MFGVAADTGTRRGFVAEARFFAGRFLVSRVVPRERGFAAMIPLQPRDGQHGMPRLQESRARFAGCQ
jgi:hypothetical protein